MLRLSSVSPRLANAIPLLAHPHVQALIAKRGTLVLIAEFAWPFDRLSGQQNKRLLLVRHPGHPEVAPPPLAAVGKDASSDRRFDAWKGP